MRDLVHIKSDQEAALGDLKKKLSSLGKLEIVKKIPKQNRVVAKPLLDRATDLISREGQTKQEDLSIPDYLLCPIAGDFMTDPVLIESGQTFERAIVERHFEM